MTHTVVETMLNIVPETSKYLRELSKYHQDRLMSTVNVKDVEDRLLKKQLQNMTCSFYTHILEIRAKFDDCKSLENIEIKTVLTKNNITIRRGDYGIKCQSDVIDSREPSAIYIDARRKTLADLEHVLFAYNNDFHGFYSAILRQSGHVISFDMYHRFMRLKVFVAMCTEPYTVYLQRIQKSHSHTDNDTIKNMFCKIKEDKNIAMGQDQSIFNNIQKKYMNLLHSDT